MPENKALFGVWKDISIVRKVSCPICGRFIDDAAAGIKKGLAKRKDWHNIMKNLNLQDVFLNQARKERIPVTFFLVNGFQFRGMVKGFDNYTVILECDGKQELIYKHAISTIVPQKSISILNSEEDA